ncbi:MAG: hypothetical protein AB3N16_05615, partial [Flavobacteriaceae bacterium]
MKTRKNVTLALLFIQTLLLAQPYAASIGNTRMYYTSYSGPIIKSTAKTLSYPFLKKVGGVSFEQTLSTDKNLEINYIPTNQDGSRLQLVVDGTTYYPEIMDWQLKPIANFADSDNRAAVTLLGENDEIDSASYYNVQYHEALENTLLGLRLLQVDLILLDIKELHELPKDGEGNFILGTGEPNVQRADTTQINDVAEFMNEFSTWENLQSWLFTDSDRTI